ncbi:MAG: hypothetical protein LUD27_01770 [Clostridia bacterium]|nr:hypothetical protein [Clostridia bacterium]
MLALCKKYNSTPAVMIALLSSRAIKSVYSDAIKPIVCCVSVDRRKALNRKNTFRNCIGGAMLSYNGDTEKLSLENQSDVLKKQLELQKDENYIKSRVNSYIEKFKNSDNKTEYVVRREYSSFFANKNFSTFLLSYPGKIDFGECNKSVAAVSLYTSGIKGLSINMIAAADKFFIDIVSDFETQDIVMALIREFAVNGLACSAGDLTPFDEDYGKLSRLRRK